MRSMKLSHLGEIPSALAISVLEALMAGIYDFAVKDIHGKNVKGPATAHTLPFDDVEKKKRTAVG